MKNITLSLDDDTYREARVAAAQRDQSVSAMVRELIHNLTQQSKQDANDRALSQATLAASAPAFAAAWDNTEDDVYNAL